MSDDRTLLIYRESRTLRESELREESIFLESRTLPVSDEERELEVWLP
jgi:hypothetical protein